VNKKQRILLVDDERELALMMTSLLDSHGFSTRFCFSGEEALSCYKSRGFDLLITDLNMRVIPGFELIHKVREFNPYQKILVITGIRTPGLPHSIKFKTLDLILKPFSAGMLLKKIDGIFTVPNRMESFSKNRCRMDLMNICSLNGCNLVFEFRSKTDCGRIYLQRGVFVHAQTNSKQGREAFVEILTWENGGFSMIPMKEKPRIVSFNESFYSLLDMSASGMAFSSELEK
jgi:CheY-like chemotaxis protein